MKCAEFTAYYPIGTLFISSYYKEVGIIKQIIASPGRNANEIRVQWIKSGSTAIYRMHRAYRNFRNQNWIVLGK